MSIRRGGLALGAVALLTAFATGSRPLGVVGVGFLVAAAVTWLWTWLVDGPVSVTTAITPAPAVEGDRVRVTCEVRRMSRVPVYKRELIQRALDETGTVFWDYKKAPSGLPMVNTVTGTNSDALREAAAVASALPADLAKKVDHVEVTTVDSISLELHNDKRVVWGSSAQSDTKADVLVALMKAEPDVARYDVSVPGQPVTSKSVD